MPRPAAIAIAIGLALALPGCGGEDPDVLPADEAASTTQAPAAPALAGRTFLLDRAEVDGATRALVGERPIELAFLDGRIAAQPGCNGIAGAYHLEDGRIVRDGDWQQTLMACADEEAMRQDDWFAALLAARPQLVVAGTSIELRTADTVVRGTDREVADPDRPLAGTTWRVTGRIDGEGAMSGEPWMDDSELTLAAGGTIRGRTPCGPLAGRWALAGDVLTLELADRGACGGRDDPGQGEQQTFALLDGDLHVEIEAATARLVAADGRGVELTAAP